MVGKELAALRSENQGSWKTYRWAEELSNNEEGVDVLSTGLCRAMLTFWTDQPIHYQEVVNTSKQTTAFASYP